MVDLTPLFIGPIGPLETVLIFLALVLLFGADRIPKLADALGQSLAKFEQGKEKAEEEVEKVKEEVDGAVDEKIDPDSSEADSGEEQD